jgi:hypothetical protein
MCASSVSTAKCTSVRLVNTKIGSRGSRSWRYWWMALAAVCPLSGFLSSRVTSGDAVDRQHHIQRLLRLRAEMQLPGEPQPIGPVARLQLRVQAVRRAEEGDAQVLPKHLKPWRSVARRHEHPATCTATPAPACRSARTVQRFQLVPHLALGRADEGQRLVGEERALTVEALCGHPRVAPGQQDRLDGGLESGFGSSFARHHSALLSGCSRWCAVHPHLSRPACRPAR